MAHASIFFSFLTTVLLIASASVSSSSSDHRRPPTRSSHDVFSIPLYLGTKDFTVWHHIVYLHFGSSKSKQALIVDTGSALTWTQCEPCLHCYDQFLPKFDPYTIPNTFRTIKSHSSSCTQLRDEGMLPAPAPEFFNKEECTYESKYVDQSFSVGVLSKDTLTAISSTDKESSFPGFYFGCGLNNSAKGFGKVSGVLGLGRGRFSFFSQIVDGNVFSYCLPSSDANIGRLTFGKLPYKHYKYTPLFKYKTHYVIQLVAIYVNQYRLDLDISSSVFSSRMMIDSGAPITRLPHSAYEALRNEFRNEMKRYNYPTAPSPSRIFDTCYNVTKGSNKAPKLKFKFHQGLKVYVSYPGTLFRVLGRDKWELRCLAFTGDDEFPTIGSAFQMQYEVEYDLRRGTGRVGFRRHECN